MGNIHLSWDVVINRIRLGGLICGLKIFLQLNMCQELEIFCSCIYVLGCRLSVVRLCDSDFGITPVEDIIINIIIVNVAVPVIILPTEQEREFLGKKIWRDETITALKEGPKNVQKIYVGTILKLPEG